jgi:hypothetical protein
MGWGKGRKIKREKISKITREKKKRRRQEKERKRTKKKKREVKREGETIFVIHNWDCTNDS